MQYLIQRICLLAAITYLVGCSYTQPAVSEPHGTIHPAGALRIVKIDGEALRNFSFQKTAIRVAPGPHVLTLKYGQTEKPVAGSRSPYSEYPLEVEANQSYYLKAKIHYRVNNVGLGIKFRQIDSWEPVMIDAKEAQESSSQEASPQGTSNEDRDVEESADEASENEEGNSE